MSTAPIFAPDGSLGDIPSGQLAAAVKAGAKPGVNIIAPDGSKGVVPADRYVDAAKAGAKIAPFEEQDVKHPGFWHALLSDAQGMAKGALETGSAVVNAGMGNPTAAVPLMSQIAQNVSESPEAWKERRKAGYSLPYRVAAPVGSALGVNVPGMEQSAAEGDVAGVAGHAVAVPAAMAATAGVAHAAPAIVDLGKVAAASETAGKVAASAKVLGAAAEELPVVSKVVKAGRKLGELKDIWNPADATKENVPYAGEENTAPRTLITDPSTGRPEFSDVVVAKQTAPPAPAAKPAEVQQALEKSLGGQPLVRGVSLRNQPAAQAVAAGKLPEGFTPVDSSVLKGYKYDPEAKEFTAITQNGQSYTHGEVTPDQVKAFEDADSQGRAWTQQIRNNNPLVRKNGNAVKPAEMQNAQGEIIPKAQAGAQEDLTPVLQQSLENVQAPKGGMMTTADPAALTKRWGVDQESLASGREQTRGMSPEQTEQYIQKLSESYKNGQAVEPVMETRDADNNIIAVDGRARAIAAERAGVKRIPIMVRRMPPVKTTQ